MNFFETKKVKLYSHINGNPNHYGDPVNDIKLRYLCDLMVDIQPATAKLLEKEFGMANEATFVLWVETMPSKDIIIEKDMYVKFEYENYENLYQVVDRSRWLGNDEFFDDYTSFSVKLVKDIPEKDFNNEPLMAYLNSNNELKVDLKEVTNITTEEPDDGDDYYG